MYSAFLLLAPWVLWPAFLVMNLYFSGTVNCNNNSGDYTLIQTAVSGGGTTTLHNTCNIQGNTVNVPAGATITGDATITGTGTWAFNITADNITINGLTLNGEGILTSFTSGYGILNNHTITNNTFENITSNNPAILMQWMENNLNISNNTFFNVGKYDWGSCVYDGGDVYPNAIENVNGLNNSKIDNNHFNEICGDAIHLADNKVLSVGSTITVASNNEVGYNDFQNVFRIAVEWQGTAGGSGYDYSRTSLTRERYVIGNAYHNNTKVYYQSYFNSLVAGTNTYQVNNTAVVDVSPSYHPQQPASFFEVSREPGNIIAQGNVTATSSGASTSMKYAYTISQPNSGTAQFLQNVIHCGPTTNFWHFENTGTGGSTTVQYNYTNNPSACPGTIASFVSSLSPSWDAGNPSSFPTGGNGTWNMGVVSQLSVIKVNFFVDSPSGSPVVAQTISDVSSSFATDRRWKYHATFNTSSFGNGSHTLYAVVTDVKGATSTISTPFTVGSGPVSSSTIQPDWFTGTVLKDFWTPTTNANETISVSGGTLRMALAAGTNNDAFVGGNNSVRIMQSIPSGTDFKIYLRIDGIPVTQKYNGVGIMVIQDSGTYLRNEVAYGMGTSNVYQLASDIVSGGSQTVTNNISLGASISTPFYLLLQRSGTTYTLSYSSDGVNFTASTPYTSALTESLVGVYAWNFNSTVSLSPGYTAQVKYFNPQMGVSISPSSTAVFGNTSITGGVTLN